MSEAEQADSDVKLIRQHLDALAEHFDSVEILVTRYDPAHNGTINVNLGSGNWFSRYGQIRNWLVKCEEQTRIDTKNSQDDDDHL